VANVSVVVPNYNHARYLEQRMRSILDQTYQDFEIVYLDDASTDHSGEVFAQFSEEPRVRAYVNETNSGCPFVQWNKGVGLARGGYVWIAESDDYADPRFLDTLVDLLERHPNVGIAYCQSQCVDENGALLDAADPGAAVLDAEHWSHDFVRDGREECAEFLVIRNTIPNASAVLLRRQVYEEAGGANEDLLLAGDWMLWAKMLKVSDLAYVAEPLSCFRRHSRAVRATSQQSGRHVEENYRVLKYILSEFDVPEASARRARNRQMNGWVNHLVWKRRRMPMERLRRVYGLAKEVDPHPVLRFVRNMVTVPVQELAGRGRPSMTAR